MTAPRLSATEALLACAAAVTDEELHAARMALIRTGQNGFGRPADTTLLLAGDGTAGNRVLGARPMEHEHGPRARLLGRSTAARSTRIKRDRDARHPFPRNED